MPLVRKIRFSGNSTVVTLPSQLLEAYDISNGDIVEVRPNGNGEIIKKKLDEEQSKILEK
jgi:antitoxin component of MazEF toxin-antitoxin module